MLTYKQIVALTIITLFSISLHAQTKKPASKGHTSSLAGSIAAGKVVYSKVCITCHMADAKGVPNMNPPLIKTTYVLGDKTKLLGIIFNGLSETIEVGDADYSNVMPSQAYLSDQEVADVLTYVRNSFGNKASAVTLAEVKKARAAKK